LEIVERAAVLDDDFVGRFEQDLLNLANVTSTTAEFQGRTAQAGLFTATVVTPRHE
jgi:hypothetical protein